MANEMFQARLDDEFADEIHGFRDDHHMNKSEAVRHLLRKGLDAEQKQTALPDGGEVMKAIDAIADRQEEISEDQELAEKRQTLALAWGLVYIVVTITTDVSGISWGLAGIVSLALVWYTSYHVWSGDSA
jgi:hypothetical protein